MPRTKQFDEEQAIQKFTEVFWQKGYNACSVGDLVAASGLSRSSLYDTFGDKEQLFIRCLETYSADVKNALGAATQHQPTATAKIEAALRMPFQTVDGTANCKGCLAVNTMGELDGTTNQIQQIILKTKTGWESFLASCIEEGQQSGELITTDTPQALAGFLYTTFCGLLVLQKANPDPSFLLRNIKMALHLLQQ